MTGSADDPELLGRGGAIPCERLRPLLDRYEASYGPQTQTKFSLARRFFKVRHEAEYVSFDLADKLLVDMGLEYEWYGELADLYDSPLIAAPGTCGACECPMDDETPGCSTCKSRHGSRKFRERRRGPTLVVGVEAGRPASAVGATPEKAAA